MINVYAVVSNYFSANSDIYKQTSGFGDFFIALGQEPADWRGITVAPNGDVYACAAWYDIYKQTGGVGNFIALGQVSADWRAMTAAPNGDVYACESSGDIYKQTGGVGDFIALGQASRIWMGMAAAPNGDVYACVSGGDIYKQTGGVGDFIALGQVSRVWRGMAAAPNGDIYACVFNGDIYKQTGGAGDFIALGQVSADWRAMTAAPNGDVYACVFDGDIYKQTGGTGDFIALGQVSRGWTGIAAASFEDPDEILRPTAYTVDSQLIENPENVYDSDVQTYALPQSDLEGFEAVTRWHTFNTPTIAYSSLALHIVSVGENPVDLPGNPILSYLEYTINGGSSWEVIHGGWYSWGDIYASQYIETVISLSPGQDVSLLQVRARSGFPYESSVYVYEIWVEGYAEPEGSKLFIADTENHRIVKLLADDFSYISEIGSLGSGDDQFNYPTGIASDKSYVYVLDRGNDRIVKRSASDLSYISQASPANSGGGIALAGTSGDGKILRSTNYGANWSDLGQQFSQSEIRSLAYLGDGIVLAGTGSGGRILRSTDYGATWSNLGQQFSQTQIFSLAYLENGIALAGTHPNGKILRSTDYGATWTDLNTQFGQWTIYSLAYLENGIALAGTYPDGRILRSTDYGATWSNLGQQFGQSQIVSLASLGGGIALAGTGVAGKILRSTDYGATWADLGTQFGQSQITSFASLGNGIVLAGTNSGGKILRSTDYGATWSDLGQQFGESEIRSLAYLSGGIALAGASSGKILRSTNYGANWSNLGQQFSQSYIYSLVYLDSLGDSHSIATDGTYLYVPEPSNNRIAKRLCSDLSVDSYITDTIGTPLFVGVDSTHIYSHTNVEGRLNKNLISDGSSVATLTYNTPIYGGIATTDVENENNIYNSIGLETNNYVQKRLKSDLSLVSSFGSADQTSLRNPRGIAYDGTYLYVVNQDVGGNGYLVKIRASDMSFVSTAANPSISGLTPDLKGPLGIAIAIAGISGVISLTASSLQQQDIVKIIDASVSESADAKLDSDFEYIKSDLGDVFVQDAYKYVLQAILDNFTPEMLRQYQDSILFKSFIEALALEIANVKFQITQSVKQLNIQQAASLFLSLWSNITGISRKNINGVLETDKQYRQRLLDSIFWDKISNSTIKKSVLLRTGLGSIISDRSYAVSQRSGFVNPSFPAVIPPTAKYLSNLVEISLDGAVPTDEEINAVYDEVSSLLAAGNVVGNIVRDVAIKFLDVNEIFGRIAYGPIFMQWLNDNAVRDLVAG